MLKKNHNNVKYHDILWMKGVWVSGTSSADVSLSLLHAAQQSDFTELSKLSLCLHLLVETTVQNVTGLF